MPKSTTSAVRRKRKGTAKPAKPHRDFPLFAHATGRWAKKVRGKLHYFGPWSKPQDALQLWLEQKDALLAGRTPRPKLDGVTISDLANAFLTSKKLQMEADELSSRSFSDYYATCSKIVKEFGTSRLVVDLNAADFESIRASIARKWGPVRLGNEVGRIRSVFKYGYDASLIDQPVRFGPSFKRPSARTLRQARAKAGTRMLEANEIRNLLEVAGPALKAMVLLGINCGFGNTDVATLPLTAINFNEQLVSFPRPKTANQRRCPLWPETVKALQVAIKNRPTPTAPADAQLVFVTKYGKRWIRFPLKPSRDALANSNLDVASSTSGVAIDSVRLEFNKLLHSLNIKRPGLGFYALRHTFETIAGDTRDQVAVNFIMGHVPHSNDMSAVYRERIDDQRLQVVVDHVRLWLFG